MGIIALSNCMRSSEDIKNTLYKHFRLKLCLISYIGEDKLRGMTWHELLSDPSHPNHWNRVILKRNMAFI